MWTFSKFRKCAWTTTKVTTLVAFPTACFIHTLFDYIGEITPALGPSMLPTLSMVGDLILIERLPGWRDRIQVGDPVVFKSPIDPGRRVVKRVLGKAGDTLCVDPTRKTPTFVQIPRGHVWLQGDNYTNSTDSRVHGPVPLALLRGRVLARVWPGPQKLTNNVEIIPGRFTEPAVNNEQ
ncbi:hypothetical protein GGH19_004896 [Coemansia sp. RSA 1807]|nr:hypothetical protein LPJ62_001916 [Coemansia sp. RSA 2167]KAJ2141642.1 hypothetical protein IW142_004743 [Coemansia sp. RSA 564]KAJ2150993.1 hypothetical protein GGH15_006380 [Coemansia sp. RSA 562]KAJ2181736.1 hypothetical protein GGF45_001338 [Coemansia sp. RSA 551]KAJ2193917.1 hypothetical protein IW144_004207 [Coemansia sp. RSA 522]KAJ2274523.1 hypothetical protein GGH14_004071 [Coemansia sp. RSA 370]KAJ2531513.1 hypothetical protein IWW43_003710 [Coemansia sp. RSA 1935]KAJ2571526.1 h